MFSKKILIVEDSKFLNNSLYMELSKLGHKVAQAFNLENAFLELESEIFDFIILDLCLPDGEGDELIENFTSLKKTKIIVFTSDKDKERRDYMFELGVLDYIQKDSSLSHIIQEISKYAILLDENKENSILVIDDSAFVLKKLKKLLEARNYTVFTAKNAKDGMQILNKNKINLVVLDLEMPDMNGIELLKIIKKEKKFSKLPVVILSGIVDMESISEGYKQGACEFLKKPFISEEIIFKIDAWIDYARKGESCEKNKTLLEEYKEAVDFSNIVSKTDSKGIITYVNDKFCEISGFQRSELLGKPHNIVRHPDMPKEVFKELWENIKAKKTWRGIVKNIKKDGGYYYVDSFINPILDFEGNIVEFIAIRHDITQIEDLKNRFKKDLKISNKNFQEAYRLSLEYEKAIDESTILSRTDKDGKIIYANSAFTEKTGWGFDELVGKNHNILRHQDNPNYLYETMWMDLYDSKIWRGVIKNKTKNNEVVYFDTTICPIKNDKNETIEYMGIRNDVTELVQLHQELEGTQREVIFKLGEIGEMRNKETGQHVKRVAEFSKLLGQLYGLDKKYLELLYMASPMHDIGKIAIADEILLKPSKLEPFEFEIMKEHSSLGHQMLKNSKGAIFKAAAIIAHQHHEKWNGLGYPQGLDGKNIHIFGRITAIADVFDALGSERPYKKAWEMDRILDLFESEKGEHFDPKLTTLFLKNVDKFVQIKEKFKD